MLCGPGLSAIRAGRGRRDGSLRVGGRRRGMRGGVDPSSPAVQVPTPLPSTTLASRS
jgi:hypothetical protein